MEIQNKIKIRVVFGGGRVGKNRKKQKWNMLWLSNLVRGTSASLEPETVKASCLLLWWHSQLIPVKRRETLPVPPSTASLRGLHRELQTIWVPSSSQTTRLPGRSRDAPWRRQRKPSSDTSPKKLLEGNRVQWLVVWSLLSD